MCSSAETPQPWRAHSTCIRRRPATGSVRCESYSEMQSTTPTLASRSSWRYARGCRPWEADIVATGFDLRQVGDRMWPVLRQLMKGHTLVYRATHGLVGHRFPGAPPTLLLDHVGAKSGKTRTSPVSYMRDGENFVLVASKGGHPRNPAWYHNLRANPDTTVQVGAQQVAVRARVATKAERTRLWPRVVDLYGGYRDYQERTEREIPLVILEPAVITRERGD